MKKMTLILLLVVIATAPLLFGAVQPNIWSIYTGLIFLAFIIDFWQDALDFGFVRSRLFALTAGLFLVFTLLQTIPVPAWLFQYCSPVQYLIYHQASSILSYDFFPHSLSYAPAMSISEWMFLLSLLMVFGLLRQKLVDNRNFSMIAGIMMAVALLEGLYGLLQVLIPTLTVLWSDVSPDLGAARGTFINKNHFAGFIEMVWPLGLCAIFAMARIWRENIPDVSSGKKLKLFLLSDQIGFLMFLGAALGLTILSLLLSQSRAGISGAFIGFSVFLLLSHLGGEKNHKSAFMWIVLGVCFVLFYGNIIGFGNLIRRFLAVGNEADSRLNIWINTISIIKDHPLGVGLANYKIVMPIYNSLAPPGINYDHAHNDYLELLTETGWPGFIALISGFLIFMGRAVRRIRKYGPQISPLRFYIGIGAYSGLVSIAFHSFFDFNLQIPSNLLYFIVLLAIVDAGIRPGKEVMGFAPMGHIPRRLRRKV